jgi:DNA-binding SARP family transcriptional activator/predicted ATPase
MEFRLLGPFEVVYGGSRLDLGSRKQRALLAMLVLNADHVVTVDQLVEGLWGEAPPARALVSLQAYVSNLRRVLEPARAAGEPSAVLVSEGPGYRLRAEPASVDAARFEGAAVEGRRLLDAGMQADARTVLADAVALWRGPALADFSFDAFAQTEAARLEELRLAATEDLLQADADLGFRAGAVAELEALVAAHPLRERLWALLMVALYRAGRQADALRAYQSARQHLLAELGVEPGPGLRRLEADILAQVPSLEWPAPEAPPPPPPPVAAGSAGGGPAPILGRQKELARVQATVARAAAGVGGVVLVRGEPGIGKTRLVEEAAAGARMAGLLVGRGGAVEGGGTPAYWPWVEVVRSLLTAAGPAAAVAAVGPSAPELAQLVPEIKELADDVELPPPAVDPETARVRLFDAVARFLASLARSRGVAVVLDDLQWADAASLQLLSFLAPRLRDTPLVVLGTYRPGEVPSGHLLGETLAALARHEVADRLDLAGLAEAEVGALLAAAAGVAFPSPVVARVRSLTEGNPFFVTELARLLRTQPEVAPADVARCVPGGVRDVLRQRLSRLPQAAASLLAVAAVIGREFDAALLGSASGQALEGTAELLEAALRSGVVLEHPEAAGRFRFSHDLVREAILAGLTALRRARLHQRVGEAIEALHGDDERHTLHVAHHFFQAVPVAGPERAFPYTLRAAELALTGLAHEQAEVQLRRALELVPAFPPGRQRDRQELDVLLRLSLVLTMTRGHADPEIGEVLDRARAIGAQLGETDTVARALFGLMLFHVVAARYPSARQAASQLLELAADTGRPGELVTAHIAMGTVACHEGNLHEARQHLEAALALPAGLHDPALVARLPLHPVIGASCFLAWAVWELGDRARATELVEGALEFAMGIAHDLTLAHAFDAAARIAVLDCDPERAKRRSERALELRERQGSPLYAAIHAVHHGWACAHLGQPEEGIAELQRGLMAMEAIGAWMLHTLFLALRAEAQAGAGQLDEALASLDEALAFVERTGERFWEAELHRLRGELLYRRSGGAAEAAAELERALHVATGQGAASLAERAVESLARLEEACGPLTECLPPRRGTG